MIKNKNYKKMVKNAVDDKINNVVFLMKFLDSKGGSDLVKEYFSDALPTYIRDYEGSGDAKKWVLRQLLRSGHLNYMKKVLNEVQKGLEFLFPLENNKLLEESEEKCVTQIKCKYIKKLMKQAKKYECDFDIRDYYCNHACIPLISGGYSDIYLKIQVKLTDLGCIQTVKVDESTLKKDKDEIKGKE